MACEMRIKCQGCKEACRVVPIPLDFIKILTKSEETYEDGVKLFFGDEYLLFCFKTQKTILVDGG